jgi:ABC-2 type transport system ATP-binding protein
MPEAVPLYPEMRVVEYLAFRAELKEVPRRRRRAQIDLAMQKASIADVASLVIGKLSKGYRQRVGLADALVSNPPLLILDEPTAGLDPNQIREVRKLIKDLGTEHTVLLSTHILSEVETSCTRVLLIARGKLRAEGSTAEILGQRAADGVELVVRGRADDAMRALSGIAGIARIERDASARANTRATAEDVHTLRALWDAGLEAEASSAVTETAIAALVGKGVRVRGVRVLGGSLEDVFAELTDESRRQEGDVEGNA